VENLIVPPPVWLVFLLTGPEPIPPDQAALRQSGHMHNLQRIHAEGRMSLVGPIKDPTGRLRGVMILSGDRAAVEKDLRPDPYLIHQNMVVQASQLHVHRGDPKGKPDPSAIREHRLVLLIPVRGANLDPGIQAKQDAWLKSSANGFALAGRFEDREVLAVRSTDTIKVLAAACRAPLVQAGLYRPLVYPVWFSQDSLGQS
jgi:uncharacterized protein YciI